MITWGCSAVGSAAHVIEKAEKWEQGAYIIGVGPASEHKDGDTLMRQAARCVEAIKAFADRLPAGYHMSVSTNGCLSDGSETWNVSMGAYKPVPNV